VACALERILCPTDFSSTSALAFQYAAAIAEALGAELEVLHVHAIRHRVAHPYIGARGLEPVAATDIERDVLAETLRVFVESQGARAPAVSWHLEEDLDVPLAIARHAHASNTQLIVVGTHGRSGVRRRLLGSTAERVFHIAPCSVLAVPAHALTPGSREWPPARVVCAVDFSKVSNAALECAAAVAAKAGAALSAVHVLDLPPGTVDAPDVAAHYRTTQFALAAQVMREVLDSHVPRMPKVSEFVLVGRPAAELQQFVHAQNAGLIVMGACGQHSAGGGLFGSLTLQVLRDAPCAVLALRV
jgi:nucleotide-binding universal stress UspA family protein